MKSERFILPLVKTLLINFFIFFIIIFFFNNKKFKFKKLSQKDFLFLFLTLLSYFLWMFNTPLLRAGGYSYWTFFILSFLVLSFNFQEFFDLKKIKKYLIILISITIILNLNRIYKESEKYDTLNPFFFTEWGKLHHMKYLDKERLIKLLTENNFEKNILNLKLDKLNNTWFVIKN